MALAPDGRTAACAVTRYSMEDNKGASSLWLLPTGSRAPRRLTHAGEKDAQPAWSPSGDRIAFLARRSPGGTVVLGIVLLGEPANAARIISVALIIAGIVGLKLATPA